MSMVVKISHPVKTFVTKMADYILRTLKILALWSLNITSLLQSEICVDRIKLDHGHFSSGLPVFRPLEEFGQRRVNFRQFAPDKL
jgi:hypothetical protein